MREDDGPLSNVNVVLVMAYGSLVFVLLFIFVKRQIMRFAVKSRGGPHVPIGHNARKELKQEIEAKLNHVQKIHFEPRLLTADDNRLAQSGGSDTLYRMRALDAIRDADFPFRELGGTSTAVTAKTFRSWLLQLRNSHSLFRDNQSGLIDTVLDGYNRARHEAQTFNEAEFRKYREALTELASFVKTHGGITENQYHQSAAKDLTHTADPSAPATSSTSPTHSTCLTSAAQQRSKRPRNFLELKNFKDNYNTLDSSF